MKIKQRAKRAQLFLMISVMAACTSPPASLTVAGSSTGAPISAQDLHVRLGILAHDSMRGREAGTPEIDRAARYIAGEVGRLGLRAAGDTGTFFQSVPLERRLTRAVVMHTHAGAERSLNESEILPIAGLGGLPDTAAKEGAGPLIFAGHLLDPDVGGGELAADQLRDAIVIVRLAPPAGVDPNAAEPRPAIASLFGSDSPASAVLIVAEEAEEEFWEYAAEVARKGVLSLASAANGPTFRGPPFFLLSSRAAEELIGRPLSATRQPLTDLGTLSFALNERVESVEGRNVVAVVPGRDPERAGQFVTLGAHYDHVGVGTPVHGDSIYNGADDNASGASALLEVAEALMAFPAAERPARSVLFLWSTAEEAGLLGSEYFTDHPTVPRQAIVAHINLDMVGRNHPDTLYSVGSRRLSSELGDIVEAANARQVRPFTFNFEYDVPGHPEQIYCRSDHYNFARYGIPIVFFTTGMHDEYHAPGDEIALIDSEKAARVATLVRDIVLDLANRPLPPTVDRPVPPPGTPCT